MTKAIANHHTPTPYPPYCTHHPKAKPQPSNPNVAWYRRERARWIAFLGGCCAKCGTTEELEFDHDVPRDWQPSRTSRWQRLRNYIKDIKAGRVKSLLCRSCNASKGYPAGQLEQLDAAQKRKEEQPF